MYEERIKELSKKIGEKELKTFYILKHKKYRREIYFQNDKKAIEFINLKFTTKKCFYRKKIIYFFIKKSPFLFFLKKIKLSKKMGDVIFVAGTIKCFDLIKKEVLSFPVKKEKEDDFMRSEKFKKKFSEKGFAPKVYTLDKKKKLAKEELLTPFLKGDRYPIFKKLMEFHRMEGIEKVHIGEYTSRLKKELNNKKIKNRLIKNVLDSLGKKDIELMITALHGDFAKENTLIKSKNGGKEIVFTDWNPYKGLITNSLLNYFRETKNIKSSKYFSQIIKAYPKDVQENIDIYLILSEISLILKGKDLDSAILKIKNYLPL